MTKSRPLTKTEKMRLIEQGLEPHILADTLRILRHSREQTIIEAARSVGVDPGTIRRWEQGKFDASALRLMSYFLGAEEANDGQLFATRKRAEHAEMVVRDLRATLDAYYQVRRDARDARVIPNDRDDDDDT